MLTIYFRWNQSRGHDGMGGLLRPITLVFWSFASMFLLCEYGQMVTTRFEDIDEAVYQSEWHSFPDKIQRILPTIINNTQQLVIISGFCDVEYTRETFDSVSWTLTNNWFSIFLYNHLAMICFFSLSTEALATSWHFDNWSTKLTTYDTKPQNIIHCNDLFIFNFNFNSQQQIQSKMNRAQQFKGS